MSKFWEGFCAGVIFISLLDLVFGNNPETAWRNLLEWAKVLGL